MRAGKVRTGGKVRHCRDRAFSRIATPMSGHTPRIRINLWFGFIRTVGIAGAQATIALAIVVCALNPSIFRAGRSPGMGAPAPKTADRPTNISGRRQIEAPGQWLPRPSPQPG